MRGGKWKEGGKGMRSQGWREGATAQSNCAPRSLGGDPETDHLRCLDLKTGFLRISSTVDISIPVTELGISLPFFVFTLHPGKFGV